MTSFLDYICLDLETTGLEPRTCDIIEIALIRVRNKKIVDRFSTFVYTPLEISSHVQYLTGITASDLEGKPDFITLIQKLEAFIGSDPILGHNIAFDASFLLEKGVRIEKNSLWDTYLLSNILYPELPSHSLETNTKYFNIAHEESHRAMADVLATHELWDRLISSFPGISPEQRKKIQMLAEKSAWPLLDFFLQERKPAHESLPLEEIRSYHPEKLPPISPPENTWCSIILARGSDPVDMAKSFRLTGKTLFIAAFDYSLEKLKMAFPGAPVLLTSENYLDPDKRDRLMSKSKLDDAETMLLLKTILFPSHVEKEDFRLSHPERKVWQDVAEKEGGNLLSSYEQARISALQKDTVITNHWHLLKSPELRRHFDDIVILEPHLLEDNATYVYGKALFEDQWYQQSSDASWKKAGKNLFSTIHNLGNLLVPQALYPEHITLTSRFTESHEFSSLKKAVEKLFSETSDQGLKSYLSSFNRFFNSSDPSWVRWFTVDPKKHETSLHLAPLSVKSLLFKNLFENSRVHLISDTVSSFSFLPQDTLVLDRGNPIEFEPVLPALSRIRGTKKDGDHTAAISYLAEELQKLTGKIGIIFSSKAVLKRYFFDLFTVLPETLLLLGEDISGGTGKLRDRYLSSAHENKVFFLTYRHIAIFAPEILDFSTIILQSLPFDPPGLPIHQARQMQCQNSFMDYALPRAKENMRRILNAFSRHSKKKQFIMMDRRIQEQHYGQEFLKYLK